MNGTIGIDFHRGLPRMPKELRRPRMMRHLNANRSAAKELADARRAAKTTEPATPGDV